ncbi:MAG TPA: hypothetical protein PLF11_12510, partial [Bacillota bacterium]|nr:hypothetical protein [Bacillota bacterium]
RFWIILLVFEQVFRLSSSDPGWFGRYELSEFAPATAPPFSGITPPANPQAEPGYIIWLYVRVSRAVGKGSQAVSNPP